MRPFETIDHTADLALVVRGRDLAELCANAARGLMAQVADFTQPRTWDAPQTWQFEASEAEELLLAWLRELLFLHETEARVFTDFVTSAPSPHRLVATARPGPLLADEPLTAIKAVTYHNLAISRSDAGLQVTLVFDL